MSLQSLVGIPLTIALIALSSTAVAQSIARPGYKGIVVKSDDRKAGQQFTFANLGTPRPFVTYPNGHGTEVPKVYEDRDLVVLIFVASVTGSTETYYLNKKTNRFTLVEMGALEASVKGTDITPKVTYGSLR